MANRLSIATAKKVKKVRPTKTEQQLINQKYMGDEPTFTYDPIDNLTYMKNMTWYSYMCNTEDAREYLDTYLTNTGRTIEAKQMKSVPDSRVPDQAAWIFRMISRGANLGPNSMVFANKKIAEALTFKREVIATEDKTVNIQDRIRDKASDFIGEFEEAIDEHGYTLSMYEWLQTKEIPPLLVSKIAAFYQPIANEAAEVLSRSCDAQLAEGYTHLSKEDKKDRAKFYASILTDCERFSSNTKKMREPKKPKTIGVDKKLKFLTPATESKEFKVASIKAEKIIGAQELWVLNTKYKTLTVFYALDRGGLDVYRTAITKYDEAKSMSVRGGRKVSEHIATVLNGGKRAATKLLTELKKVDNIQQRINEDTILLKVV